MLRSTTEVIIPAIDPSTQLAVDQANILVGNLRILLDQHDKEFQFRMVELRDYKKLVEGLVGIAKGGQETEARRAEAEAVLAKIAPTAALPIPSQADLSELAFAARTAADALTRAAFADGDSAFRKAAEGLVLDTGRKEILRERVWVRKANFESDPSALPSIEDVLA
jgi:hypothetical protein